MFDFDGTLVDSIPGIVEVMHLFNREYRLPEPVLEEWQHLIGVPIMQQMQIIFPEKDNAFWQEAAERYRTIYGAKLLEYAPLFPDTLLVLQSLKKAGVEMTIVSSKTSNQIKRVLEHAEISSFFALVLGADDVLNHKPHPEAVLFTLQELSIRREDAMVIGDSI